MKGKRNKIIGILCTAVIVFGGYSFLNSETFKKIRNVLEANNDFEMRVRSGDLEFLKRKLDSGLPINGYIFFEDALIHSAAIGNQVDILEFLIDKGANLNLRSKTEKMTPLMYAALKGNEQATKFLLKNGAKVDVVSKKGFTALDLAEISDNDAVIALLKNASKIKM